MKKNRKKRQKPAAPRDIETMLDHELLLAINQKLATKIIVRRELEKV